MVEKTDTREKTGQKQGISEEAFVQEVLQDYRICVLSREASLLGRKEVLTGKAKFGIFGDGKELAQVAMAKAFQKGDFRSGYYRDQTFMLAIGEVTVKQFFAQLYADPDLEREPHSGGRQMNAHFATRSLDETGNWKALKNQYNTSADASPTAGQMARAVGLALASKLYRQSPGLENTPFSNNGNEVTFTTIGDASTSEGLFWEALNAAGVQQIPLAVSVWDDGYGISVPKEFQTTKGSISILLEGFRSDENGKGIDLYVVNGWDYAALCEAYLQGIEKVRKTHSPAVFHITEVTQPQGHSTSGSHERYKSAERLAWEVEYDCIRKFRQWIEERQLVPGEDLDKIETAAREEVRSGQKAAWSAYLGEIKNQIQEAVQLIDTLANHSDQREQIILTGKELAALREPFRRDVVRAVKTVLRLTAGQESPPRAALREFLDRILEDNRKRYNSHLYSESAFSAMKVKEVKAEYAEEAELKNGFEVLNAAFDQILAEKPEVFAFGEDVGKIGDVNQGFSGLQEKHGLHRVFDTGIREATIMGQAIGMAMRGLRPIAEIQYLDYLIYGLQPLTDDVATLLYRTRGGQKAPMIVRTRGHRLEGIWHTGSPMGMILHSLRGMYVLTPRNMVQAAGMYNTLLQSDEPALIIECLNGYRLKEKMPLNLAEFTVPLGKPETLIQGEDLTIVTYGSCVRIAREAITLLNEVGIYPELIDVQTLLPFDVNHQIVESLKKTGRLLILDEDVPGGASAFIFQKVIEEQGGYYYLDSPPVTLTAKEHRSSYGSDGDYFSKPNAEDVFEAVYEMMRETDPTAFPALY